MIRSIRGWLVLAAFAATLHAETLKELRSDCTNPNKKFFPRIGVCIVDAFQLSDFPHPTVHSFPPGGSFGFGAAYKKPFNSTVWERTFDTGAAISVRGFWYAEMKLTVLKIGNPMAAHPTNEKFGFHLYTNYQHLGRLSFYGLGPDAPRSSLTNYRENLATIGLDLQQPLRNYVTVGGGTEGLVPDVGPRLGAIPSIETRFTEANAPGLATQPPMVRYHGFLRFHADSPDLAQDFEDKVSYGYYQDTGSGHYSFRRFRVDVRHTFYPFHGARHPRRDRSLTIRALLSLSDTGAEHAVPFYMQETIGGRGMDGEATLRAFNDYRFRAPYLTVIQTEYMHRLWATQPAPPVPGAGSLRRGLASTVGLFAFYDAGQVALRRGDLDIGKMRHSAGGGIAIFVGGVVQARIFVGLGGGEGHHTFTVLPKF